MVPFQYGEVVSGPNFCGRKQLLAELREMILSGQRVVLNGERRVGKTSLIHEVFRNQKNFRTLFLDLLGIKTQEELYQRAVRSIISLEGEDSLTERVTRFAHLRPQLGADFTGSLTLTFNAREPLSTDPINEIMDLIEALHKQKPMVVIFDEFQDILQIKDSKRAIAQLRGRVQYHSDIPYIFVGSIRSKMDEIFMSPDAPFFKSAIQMTLPPLSFEEFAPFLLKRFESGDRKIQKDDLKKVFKIADNVPGDIQQFCENLWAVSSPGEAITTETFHKALRLIFARQKETFNIILSRLTPNQAKVLNALALVGGEAPAAAKFVNAAGVKNASVVKQSLENLASQKILCNVGKEWRFFSSFFKAWIQSRYMVDG
ncbi:MAG: ATP-binding protein [Deltaproteobacteria bacterium]|nr:ATP-binding protein [Deltaproteobacteria bacterium]